MQEKFAQQNLMFLGNWFGTQDFQQKKEARDFELFLKTGSGKSFAYKRLVREALTKDFTEGRTGSPKSKT